jgi:hypothetical protein
LLHAGDFTTNGRKDEIQNFVDWTNKLLEDGKFKHLVFVCGNHEKSMECKAKHQAVQKQ